MLAFNEYKTRDAAALALARRVGERVRNGVQQRATASIVVSGGQLAAARCSTSCARCRCRGAS